MARVVAIVPARGGSKGIPGKNLRLLAGRSLVEHALRAGLAAASVDEVVLSTEDDAIAAVGAATGARVVRRPPELATDEAATLPVLAHVLQTLADEDRPADTVVLLEPTSPFRSPAIIDACVARLGRGDVAAVATVTQLERNPRYIFTVDGDVGQPYVRDPDPTFTRRQDMQRLKRVNGCVYVHPAAAILAARWLAPPIGTVEMDPLCAVNIDAPLDLDLAELTAARLIESGAWNPRWPCRPAPCNS